MERRSYPMMIGEQVLKERKARKMGQVEFYNYLFPNSTKGLDSIKKKMNAIENGKEKNIDFDFIETFCKKCDITLDSILGNINYKKYETKEVCEYTGLDENAVNILHKWNLSKDEELYTIVDGKKRRILSEGEKFLLIVNCLFKSGMRSKKDPLYKYFPVRSNLTILHSIYMMAMEEIVTISGHISEDGYDEHPELYISGNEDLTIKLDARKTLIMESGDGVIYPVYPNEMIKHIAQKRLDSDIEYIVNQIKKENRKPENEGEEK